MDKNKNRTDLLAAGRKKLQQYRKKKDNKGSNNSSKGKPSSKNLETVDDGENLEEISVSNLSISDSIKEKSSSENLENENNNNSSSNNNKDELESVEIASADAATLDSASVDADSVSNILIDVKDQRSDLGVDSQVQEVKQSGLDQCNGEVLENGMGEREYVDPSCTQIGGERKPGDSLDETEESVKEDGIQREIYLTVVSRDILQFQLDEQTDLNGEILNSVKEMEGSNGKVVKKLRHCKSELEGLIVEKKELESNLSAANGEIEACNLKCLRLESELERALVELAESRAHVQGLERENVSIEANRKVLEEDRESLSSLLLEQKERSLQLESMLADCKHRMEGLERENVSIEEKRKVLEEEKESLSSLLSEQKERSLQLESMLADGKHQMEGLERENVFVQDKRKEFEEERKTLSSLLSEQKERSLQLESIMADFKIQIEGLERENVSVRDKRKELEEEKETLSCQLSEQKERFLQLESMFTDFKIQKEGLERETVSLRDIRKELEEERETLSSQLLVQKEKSLQLESILADSKLQIGGLERENGCLKEERESLTTTNRELSTQLSEQKEKLLQLETKLKETETYFEQLIEQNLYLSTNLGINESIIRDMDNKYKTLPSSFVTNPNSLSMRVHLEESRGILGNLKSSIGRMRSESISHKSGGVSKLIKAFESKPDEVQLAERNLLEDSYNSTVELTNSLELVLNQIEFSLIKANKEECNNREDSEIREKIEGLSVILSCYRDKIGKLEDRIDSTKQEAESETGKIGNQLEQLQKELSEREIVLHTISDAIDKFKSLTGISVPGDDVSRSLSTLVNSAIESIQNLRTDNLALNSSLLLAFGFVREMHDTLRKLIDKSDQIESTVDFGENCNEILELVFNSYKGLIGNLEGLFEQRAGLIEKSAELESRLVKKTKETEELSVKCDSLASNLNEFCLINGDLESSLMGKNVILEDLHSRLLALVDKFGEEIQVTKIPSGGAESDLLDSVLLKLEAMVASQLEKYEEMVAQIDLSKKFLYESNILPEISPENWSLPLPELLKDNFLPQLSDSEQKLKILTASTLEMETETQLLRDSLKKMELALETSCSELTLKISELDQSEQKLSSTKEKLGIAVAKGKGLIVQRDNLKQSLSEKSTELENCLAVLRETEAKLKSCTEVDRIEALESELSYIRNSATALRESFLIKDSVIQRIEEVLEELDLPEEFHARDLVEKIELLSRMAVVGSLSSTEPVQNELPESSVAGTDELKNRYNNLERKFYELAEHNDMLEQSLMDRNSIIQRWEDALGRITVLPSQLRSSEPDERIQWLGGTLYDAQRERDNLVLKIERLGESSEMLIVDLEESHKKISKLNAELSGVKSERDFFSQSLDRLRFDYEVEREKLISEKTESENVISNLGELVHGTLSDVDSDEVLSGSARSLESSIRKLLERYEEAKSEPNESLVSEVEALNAQINHLREEMAHESVKYRELENELDLVKKLRDSLQEELNQVRKRLSKEIEGMNEQINLLRERAHNSERENQLVSELELAVKQGEEWKEELNRVREELEGKMDLLKEEQACESERYQELVAELDGTVKQKDVLQEQLNQLREKLNVAVRKGKGLVQQRDSLKQQIETLESENLSVKKKLEEMDRSSEDLKLRAAGAENEAGRCKRAAELLVAELNESQERADLLQERQMEGINKINFALGKLKNEFSDFSEGLGNFLSKDINILDSLDGRIDGGDSSAPSDSTIKEEISMIIKRNHGRDSPEVGMDGSGENATGEHLTIIRQNLHDCIGQIGDLKAIIRNHFSLIDQKGSKLFKSVQKQFDSMKEKERENSSLHSNLSVLYEACASLLDLQELDLHAGPLTDEQIRSIGERLRNEARTKELKNMIFELQRELQEKDVQVSRVSTELSSYIREGELRIRELEKELETMRMERRDLELRVSEIGAVEVLLTQSHEQVEQLTDTVNKKEQEIEALMQALEEEEKEMEELERKNQELDNQLQDRELSLKNLEASRTKTLTKLQTTVTKFDELHSLSENLLTEIENLQSQLDGRDSEISFLRQEVTRVSDELLSSDETNKNYLSQLREFMKWTETAVLLLGLDFKDSDDFDFGQTQLYLGELNKKFASVVAELDELRLTVQSKDSLLQIERGKMADLLRKCEFLESSVRERSSASASSSSVLEIEPVREKVSMVGPMVAQVRGAGRKLNSDQVSISIESDNRDLALDEDDDKAHGFKSLTMSRVIPRFTRPISDRIDRIWVSGDRLLMRQPTLRLVMLLYWIAVHVLLIGSI